MPPLYSEEELGNVIPSDVRKPFDVRKVIARLVDGSRFDEFKALYGTTLVTGRNLSAFLIKLCPFVPCALTVGDCRFCSIAWMESWYRSEQWYIVLRVGSEGGPFH